MPLIRGMARTAVVAGTATAVSNRVSRRQANRWAAQEEYSPAYMSPQAPPQAYEQAPPPGAAAPAAADPIERLKELGELHAAGVLTDEEFAVQKAKILNA
jgi:Short C-terminal domain